MWNDLSLFAAISRAGTLSRAADETGVSAATLSRRLTAFETAMGKRLFERGARGYALTAEGRDLARYAARMADVAAEISAWQDGPRPVRISAGVWTTAALVPRLYAGGNDLTGWVPEFVASDAALDIARREIDIGLRNRRPEHPWLAGRKLRDIAFAPFALSRSIDRWIGGGGARLDNPSVRWVETHHRRRIVTRTNDSRVAMALAEAGVGRVVLPTFAAPLGPRLQQVGPEIEDLASEEWLVSHHEARHDPPIRAALTAIAEALTGRQGKAPT